MITAALTSILFLAAAPTSDVRAADQNTFANASGTSDRSVNRQWWMRFSDPKLNALVNEGSGGNYEVLAAESRIEEADALVIQQLAPLMPTATWDSALTLGPLDSLGFQFGGGSGGSDPNAPEPPDLYYQASSAVNVGIGIDITGKNILGHRAAKNDRRAAKHDVALQKQAIASAITSAYYDLVAARAQRLIVDEQVATNEKLLELTQLRFESGQATAVDVLQQRQQLAATKLLVPRAEQQVTTFEQRLSVLLGETPGKRFSSATSLPAPPPKPRVGAPSELARSRPDLRAQAERLDAASKRTKVARRSFAPQLRLSGQAGVQAIHIGDWSSQGFWSAGASLSVPLSTGGATYGQLRQARAREKTASRQLSQTTLTAIREVEDALVQEERQSEVLALYREQHEAAEAAFVESRSRYAEGVAEYLPVLTALASAQQAELNVVTAERDLLAARIALYTALGDR